MELPPAGMPPAGLPPAGRSKRTPVQPTAAVPVPAVPVRRSKKPTQGLVPIQRQVTPAEEAAFAMIEAEMGGRGRLVSALSTAQLPPTLEKVLGMIADPQHDHVSLAKICALGEVSLSKLLGMFKTAVLARGQLLAIARTAERLPDVAASVMDDSVAGWRMCIGCEGSQEIEVKVLPVGAKPGDAPIDARIPCPSCGGRGRTYWQPPHDMQKTALMIGGLLDKGGPKITTIVANQNIQAGTDSGSYDSLIGALDKHLYGEGRGRTHHPAGVDANDGINIIEGEVG